MEFKEGYLICTASMKEKILREKRTSFNDYSFLNIEELRNKLFFKVHRKALPFIMRKYHFSYSLAKEYLRAVSYIEDKAYQNPKLDSIVSVYRTLQKEKLLQRDFLFPLRLKKLPLTFIDPENTKEYRKLKEKIMALTSVYEVTTPKENHTPVVCAFETIQEECIYVMNQIKSLLKKGIDIDHIYLVGVTGEYLSLFHRLARHFEISINFPAEKNALATEFAYSFLDACSCQKSFEEVVKGLNENDLLYGKTIQLINDYELGLEVPSEYISFFTQCFKEMSFPKTSYAHAVTVVEGPSFFFEEDYVFYLGFNLGAAPAVKKEDGFLSDAELDLLACSTMADRNDLAKTRLIELIKSTPNLTITYKCWSGKDEYLPSPLIKELGLSTEHPNVSYGSSKMEDALRLSVYYDNYLKYGMCHEDLKQYGMQDIDYQSFRHSYQRISKELLDERFAAKPLSLAYSNIKLFFACPFSYFADRILRLNEFKPQMAARLGTFSHAILEDSYANDFDFEASFLKNKVAMSEDSKDDFFFEQMKIVLSRLIHFNKTHEQFSKLTSVEQEPHIVIEGSDYTFEGYIDKLLYTIIDNEVYAAIVDYKTGKDIVTLDNIEDGFHLQLPSYMYLLSKYEKFAGMKIHIIGIYLQKVNIITLDNTKNIEEQMEKNFLLQGYSVADPSLLVLLDPTFANSSYIKSLGISSTTNTFKAYSKVYQRSQQDEMIQLVEQLVQKASAEIHQGLFPIAPKMIDGKNQSCTFCKYKDICFYNYEDIVELPKKPFKGGA